MITQLIICLLLQVGFGFMLYQKNVAHAIIIKWYNTHYTVAVERYLLLNQC